MSGRRAGAGEPGSRGSRTPPSHIAVMQLFHELKQQFPALPDDAVSACIAKHCHDPSACHEHLQQASTPRSIPYPACLRNNMDEEQPSTSSADSSSDEIRLSSSDEMLSPRKNFPISASGHIMDFTKSNLSYDETGKGNNSISNLITSEKKLMSSNLSALKKHYFSEETGKGNNSKSNLITPEKQLISSEESPNKNFPKRVSNPKMEFRKSSLDETKKNPLKNSSDSNEFPKTNTPKSASNLSSSITQDPKRTDSNRAFNPKMEFRKSNLDETKKNPLKNSSASNFPPSSSPESPRNTAPKSVSSPLMNFRKSSLESSAPKTPQSACGSERTSPTSPSDPKDFSSLSKDFSSKPPISPLTSKKPPGRVAKTTFDARISKLPDESLTNATGAVRRTPAIRPASLDLPRTTDSVDRVVDNKTSPVQGVNLSVNVNCSVDVVEQNGSGARRHSAVLEVTPEPTWLHSHPPSPRSYTSVNLTLRTPTTPPQGPIDICSSPAPASLTYTTSSWDRRQGLQSRLQITVGPGPAVGSVTAVRTRPRSCYQEHGGTGAGKQRAESMPDLSGSQIKETTNHVVLLSRQKERKEQLRNELKAGKERLHSIQKEIEALRLENTPEYRTKLKKEIRHLQAQCERLTREVDRHSESRVPLGETNEEFYRHLNTGQRLPPQRRRVPPAHAAFSHTAATESDNEPRWPCHICTFRNHPLMDKCEQCEMPRVVLGKLAAPATEPQTPTATGNPPHANNTPLALGMNS